jgi:hypothetical protein
MTRTKLFLVILICLLLTGCSDGESFWVEAFMDTWLTSNGVATELGGEVNLEKLIGNLLDNAVDEVTNGEQATALDFAENNLNDIKEADELLETAITLNDPEDIKKAQELRPDDVTYVEAEAVIWLVSGNDAASRTSTTAADEITIQFVEKGGDCRSARLNQLQIRRKLLVEKLDDPLVKNSPNLEDKIYTEIGQVDDEIQKLTSGQPSLFCARFGADTVP